MNTLDMCTREKPNRLHLDEMYREAESRRQLRNADPVSHSARAATGKRFPYALAFAAVVIVIGAFLAVYLL